MGEVAKKYGPWALITGGSDGIGRAFALRLADEGVNVLLIARREGPLEQTAAEVRAKGVECVAASVDLAAPDAAERVAAAAGGREVGLLVANAGADPFGTQFLSNDIAGWDRLTTTNVNTTMRLAHRFGAAMRERGRGGMILVNSGACYGGMNGLAVYCASKAYVLALAEGLWAELRHAGVDVLTLVLGQTDTPSYRKFLEEHGMPQPTGWAKPEDVAATGLAQLPHGPIYNWGQPNNTAGYAPNSPDARRQRIIAIEQMSAAPSQNAV
jgi:short-subunit dehydrogenase